MMRPLTMNRFVTRFARGCCAALLLAGTAPTLACSKLTQVPSPESPLSVSASPPAAARPELAPLPQPAPPPRVTLGEDELLTLDETLSFTAEAQLASEHADIIAELAAWLAAHDEVTQLSIEATTVGTGSKRKLQKLSAALATQVVDALVAQGIAAERLLAVGLGASEDAQHHVVLRVSARAESDEAVTQ